MKKIWQKTLVIGSMLLAALALIGVGTVMAPQNVVWAEGGTPEGETPDDTTEVYPDTGKKYEGINSCDAPLGFVPWNCGVAIDDIDEEKDLSTAIWTIVANVAIDISVAAAYLVLGYVIYGGYQYIFANGDPGKVAAGKKVLTQAFIGLAIVMSASVILNGVRTALAGANFSANCATFGDSVAINISQCVPPDVIVTKAIQWVIGIAGAVSVIFVVIGGITYITSNGEPNKLQQAKRMILYALIGMAVVGLAEIMTAFVSDLIREANK